MSDSPRPLCCRLLAAPVFAESRSDLSLTRPLRLSLSVVPSPLLPSPPSPDVFPPRSRCPRWRDDGRWCAGSGAQARWMHDGVWRRRHPHHRGQTHTDEMTSSSQERQTNRTVTVLKQPTDSHSALLSVSCCRSAAQLSWLDCSSLVSATSRPHPTLLERPRT